MHFMLEASEEFEQLRKKRRQESPWAQKPIYVKGPGWASSWSLSDPWGHVGNKGASQGLVLAGAEQCRLGVTCSAAAAELRRRAFHTRPWALYGFEGQRGGVQCPNTHSRCFPFLPTMTSHKAADQLRRPSQRRAPRKLPTELTTDPKG